MDENIKVSIIIPVYNCEKYLDRCINSLLNQTLNTIEIVLIDDGSSDGSAEICKGYSNQYINCRYYRQCNGGVSKARNKGIQEAKGEYLIFSDADDYYEKNAVEFLYKKAIASHAEVVSGGIQKHFIDYDEIQSCEDYSVQNKGINQVIVRMTENFAINQVWGKIYLTKAIKDNEIYFDESLDCGEDLEWLCRILCSVKCLGGISKIVYHYNISENMTLSKTFSISYFDRIKKSFDSLERLYKVRGMYDEFEEMLLKRQDNNIWNGFKKINDRRYRLTFAEKVQYVKIGMNSLCFSLYKRRKRHYLPSLQERILRIKNPYILTIVLTMISYVY